MPVITGAFIGEVILGGVSVGATINAIAAVATFLVNSAIYFAVSTGVNKVFGKTPSNLGDYEGRMQMVRSPLAPRQVIYGEVRTAGPLIFAHTTGTANEYLHLIVALAGHEVEDILDVYFDDEVVVSGTGTTPEAGYTGLLDCVKLYGTDSQASDATMQSYLGAKWTTNHRLRGIAAVYVRLKWDRDTYPGGIPNISAVVKGKKLYDFRDTTTVYGTNPVLALYDYMTNTRYGLGIASTEIDTASGGTWDVAADLCDEAVTLDGGGSEDRYTVNGVTDTSVRPSQTVETIVQSMAGRLYYVAGEYHLYAGGYTTPDTDLDENDLRGPISVRSDIPRTEKFNAVKGTFANPDDNWTPVDFPAVESATYETIDGEKLWSDITLPWTTSPTMAQRLAKIALFDNRQSLTCSMPCKLTAMKCKIGDTVRVSNTRFGWTNKIFIVTGFSFAQTGSEQGPGIGVDLDLRETASTIYSWASTEEGTIDSSPNTDLPDPWTVNPPTGLTLSSSQSTSVQKSDGTFVGRILAEWTNPTDAWVASGGRIEVQYKLSSGSSWTTQALMDGEATECYISDLDEGETYDVRVRAISVLGVRSAWDTGTGQSVVVDTTGPGPITGLAIEQDTQDIPNGERDILWSWTNPTDADFDLVRIRWKVTGAGSWAQTRYTRGDAFLVRGLTVVSGYDFDFTTFDRSGNESAGPNPGYSLAGTSAYTIAANEIDVGTDESRTQIDSAGFIYGDADTPTQYTQLRINSTYQELTMYAHGIGFFVVSNDGSDVWMGLSDGVVNFYADSAGKVRIQDKLYFGSLEDTNLYRDAANALKTDDTFEALRIGAGADPHATIPLYGFSSTTYAGMVERQSALTTGIITTLIVGAKSTGDMTDGFEPGLLFRATDTGITDSNLGFISCQRYGADNTGMLRIMPYSGGSVSEVARFWPGNTKLTGDLEITGDLTVGGSGGGSAPTAVIGTPIMMVPGAGEYVGNILTGTLTTLASAANRMEIAPYLAGYDFDIDQIGMSISTASAGSACAVIFAADSNGRPTTVLAQGANVDTGTTGTKLGAITFSFTAGTLYWIGVWTSAACTLRVAQTYANYPLTWTSAATPAREAALRRTETFGTAADWTYATSQHTAVNAPFVLMRVA